MHIISVRNVNQAYPQGMRLLKETGEYRNSRAGQVVVARGPVMTEYSSPLERVLFDQYRDANPFFHLMESVWMLAGSADGRWLDRYVKDFSTRYGESNGRIHGAYGYRWRDHFLVPLERQNDITIDSNDQLSIIGEMMFNDITTRRAVLSMWDADSDLGADVRDMPCNTHVYFRGDVIPGFDEVRSVEMTVCNRSNDMIWGAYGANVVHMSVMGEVVAGLAGGHLTKYYQFSNNFHAYTDIFSKLSVKPVLSSDPYDRRVAVYPIVTGNTPALRRSSAQAVLDDAVHFVALRDNSTIVSDLFGSDWFRNVVVPMHIAHEQWRNSMRDAAIHRLNDVAATDWAEAARLWMRRRMEGVLS